MADARGAVVEVGARGVVATAEQEHPVVVLELLLQVVAHLVGAGILVLNGEITNRGVITDRDKAEKRCIVAWIEDIQRGNYAKVRVAVGAAVVDLQLLVVGTQQQGVLPAVAEPVAEQAVVHRQVVGLAVVVGQATVDHAIGEVAVVEQLAQFQLHVAVAQVLLEVPVVVQTVVQLVAQGVLVALEGLVARVAHGGVGVDLAVRVVLDGAAGRQELQLGIGTILLHAGQQRQRSVLVEVDGHRGGQQDARGIHVIDLGTGIAAQGHHAVQQVAFFIQLAADIGIDLLAAETAELHAHFVTGVGGWALALQVDQAAGRRLAVQHRGRTLEHLDAFEHVGVDLPAVEGAGIDARAVHEQAVVGLLEAADDEPVLLVVLAVETGLHATGVAQRLADGLDVAVLHLLFGDDRDRTRGFTERSIDLGGAAAVLGHVALVLADRAVQFATDIGGFQLDRFFSLQPHAECTQCTGHGQWQTRLGERNSGQALRLLFHQYSPMKSN